jgi:hypothetical protein
VDILLLTTYFKPDITANGILLTQLAQEWHRKRQEQPARAVPKEKLQACNLSGTLLFSESTSRAR